MIPKIAQTLKGRKITNVVCLETQDYGDTEGDGNTPTDLYTPSNDAYIELDNGQILKCWNSEWGGIQILDPNNCHDVSDIEFIEKEIKGGK